MELDHTSRLESHLNLDLCGDTPVPGLLLAACPGGTTRRQDRLAITDRAVLMGRGPDVDWRIDDRNLSKQHARFCLEEGRPTVIDLGSTNGVLLRGQLIPRGGQRVLHDGDVLRCGRCLLVATADLRPTLLNQSLDLEHGIFGRFHAPQLLAQLAQAAVVGRHLLLVGESGTGKELAARAIATLRCNTGQGNGAFIAHNCARFTAEDEATSTLFGVAAGTFSGVSARPGLIEQAHGGVLLLDEIQALPLRVQQTLLRFAEDGEYCRIGETIPRRSALLMVFCTNLDLASTDADQALAFDLLNRLQRVVVPPLAERRADIPEIFSHHLRHAATRFHLEPTELLRTVHPAHLETLCLLDYRDRNVRELISLAETFAALVTTNSNPPSQLLSTLIAELYPDNPVVQRSRNGGPGGPGSAGGRGRSHYE